MLWPVSCPVCGTMGRLVCDSCLGGLFRAQLPRCLWCGKTVPCRLHGDGAKIRAGAVYEGYMRELILMLKHGKYEALGVRLGKGLAELYACPDIDALVPVPLHPRSKRRYNQAEAIARGMGKAWGIGVKSAVRWKTDAATRAGLSAKERAALPLDAFELDRDICGLRLAIVDDVCTTGITLSRVAAAVRAGEGTAVQAFVVAHVPN